jgi:SAM-dependent methyltransferase
MTSENASKHEIDAVIARIREEAAAAEETERDAPKRVSVQAARVGGARNRLKRSARTIVRSLRGWVERPLGSIRKSGWRPATNRAMQTTVTRLDWLERGLGRDPVEINHVLTEVEEQLARLANNVDLLESADKEQRARMRDIEKSSAIMRMDLTARLGQLKPQERSGNEVAPSDNASTPSRDGASQAELDAFYLAFENACRGDEEEILAQLRADYLDTVGEVLARTQGTLLDLGCGRGEWLRVVAAEWPEASAEGIDLSPVMAEYCQGWGLAVETDDAVSALVRRPDASVAVITGFHVIEHLPFPVLYQLFAEVARVLEPGGVCIFETPNPENALVGSHTFYHDATHSNPLTPTAMSFLAEYHGFDPIEIQRLHPYPEAARVPGGDPLTERVNGHLCGPQDYAIIAGKPSV